MGLLGALLGALLLCLPAGGVQYINDELLWTKQSWEDYKLSFPWQFFGKREPAVRGLLDGEPWERTSLAGPLGNIQAEIEKDLRRVDLQPSRFDVSLLDESASLDAAAGVAQCKVCMALASALWRGLTAWVNVRETVPSKKRITEYAEQLCEYEVPNDVLSEWVLLRAKVQPNQAAPFFIEGNQEFYMLSQRQKQHATPSEIAAVRQACKKLIKDDAAATPKCEIVRHISGLLHRYFDHLEQRLGKASSTGGAVEAVDEGPTVDMACIDRHPQCAKWADNGECDANPTYMVGDDKQYIGQCNRACEDCHPARERQPEWNDADIEHIAAVSTDLLSVLHAKACAGGPPCAGAAGAGMEQLLAMAGGKAADGKGVGFVSGPVGAGGQGEHAAAAVDPQRLQASRVMSARESTETFIHHTPPKRRMTSPPAKLTTPASRALWAELGNKCLYVSAGWWMYELCFMDTITQFHMTEAQQVDWMISLGRFESSDWTPRNTTEAALYTPGSQVPFVSLRFNKGNDCELTEDTAEPDDEVVRVIDTPTQQGGSSAAAGEEPSSSAGAKGASGGSKGAGGSAAAAVEEEDEYYDEEEGEDESSGSGSGDSSKGGKQRGVQEPITVIRRVSELRVMCSPDTETRVFVLEPRQCRYRVELYVPQLCRVEGFLVQGHELEAAYRAEQL